MTAPLHYTPEMLAVMGEVGTRTKAIDALVADLDTLIKPLVAESAGQVVSHDRILEAIRNSSSTGEGA